MDCSVLTLAALWIALSIVAIGIGLAFPGMRIEGPPKRVADTLFFASWIGIAAFAWASLALANAMPLRDARTSIGVGAFLVASFGLWRSRFLWRALRPRAWLAFVALALILAERSVAIGPLEDTGGYHWSIVQWYEGYGIPAGLALFQWRLATHSAWLALTALLDAGALEARVASVANGLLFLTCLWFAAVCAFRWIRGCSTMADRFAVGSLAFLLQLIAKWDMRLSTSPDIPVLLVAIVIGWKMLADAQYADDKAASVAPLALLGAFALTIKLNALPLVVVCASLVWFARGLTLRARLVTTAALGVIMLPLLAASWTSTGCVLFPVSFGCVDGPSAVGPAAARAYGGIVAATAPNDIATALVATLIGAIYLVWQRRALPWRPLAGPVAIAVTGIAFTALIAPTTRFAIGYLTILPALAVAHAAGDGPFGENVTPRTLATLRAGVVALLAFAIAVPLYKEFIYSSLSGRHFDSWAERKRGDPTINALNPSWWLIPNRIDYRGPYVTAHALDFDYAVSPQMTCWNHPQPCASNPTLSALPDIRLRDPARGLGGGFMRKH